MVTGAGSYLFCSRAPFITMPGFALVATHFLLLHQEKVSEEKETLFVEVFGVRAQ
jgi:hypothetical protein